MQGQGKFSPGVFNIRYINKETDSEMLTRSRKRKNSVIHKADRRAKQKRGIFI